MSQQNLDLVKNIYAAFLRRDLPAALLLISPDITVIQSTELPWGGTFHGHEGLRQFFALLQKNLHGTALPIDRFLDAGDHVIALGRTQGTVIANARPFDVPLAHVWQIKNALAIRFTPYIDHPTMLAALHP